MNRRQLLAALGLGAGASLLPSLWGRGATAAPSRIRRLVIMTTQHQIMEHTGAMRAGNAPYMPWSYDLSGTPNGEFSRILAPLAPLKDQLLVVEGLSQVSGIPNSGYANNHDAAHMALLTGALFDKERPDHADGPSVDQVVADTIADPNRVHSLALGDRGFKGGFVNQAAGQRMPVETSLEAAFEKLFPNPDDTQPDERTKIRQARSSVLDFVKGEFDAVSPRLSGDDRKKLEEHAQMVRDLERQITSLSGLSCEAPGVDFSPEWNQRIARAKAFSDMIGAAFACDLTRVVTLQIAQLSNEDFAAPPGDVHQDFAHQADKSDSAAEEMTKYNVALAGVFAHLCDAIGKYSDENGSLLDSTAVVWLAEHGLTRKAHTMNETMAVVAGSAGGNLKTGRYVSLPRETLHPRAGPKELVGVPHNRFHITLMQAMGLTQNTIGAGKHTTGDGVDIDMSGPLSELMV